MRVPKDRGSAHLLYVLGSLSWYRRVASELSRNSHEAIIALLKVSESGPFYWPFFLCSQAGCCRRQQIVAGRTRARPRRG